MFDILFRIILKTIPDRNSTKISFQQEKNLMLGITLIIEKKNQFSNFVIFTYSRKINNNKNYNNNTKQILIVDLLTNILRMPLNL